VDTLAVLTVNLNHDVQTHTQRVATLSAAMSQCQREFYSSCAEAIARVLGHEAETEAEKAEAEKKFMQCASLQFGFKLASNALRLATAKHKFFEEQTAMGECDAELVKRAWAARPTTLQLLRPFSGANSEPISDSDSD
jgi:hypothetical protein